MERACPYFCFDDDDDDDDDGHDGHDDDDDDGDDDDDDESGHADGVKGKRVLRASRYLPPILLLLLDREYNNS